MTSKFKLTLYLTKECDYIFSYPLDTGDSAYKLRQKLGMTKEEFAEWKPKWEYLHMFDRKRFLKALNEEDYAYVSESHGCRELAMSKGTHYADLRAYLNVVYVQGYLILEYPNNIPSCFKDVVEKALLKPYGVNRNPHSIQCDLDAPEFAVAMQAGYWQEAWLSLLTYFVKYGTFLEHLAVSRYGTKEQYDLDEVIQVILDSWSGQVGLYTAFGLWKWSGKDNGAIHWNSNSDSGIHSAMVSYSALWDSTGLIAFLQEYGLGLDRLSNMFITNYIERLEIADFVIPSWYTQGNDNDSCLSDSPEWADFMGHGDEDDEDYYDDEDYDEEDW